MEILAFDQQKEIKKMIEGYTNKSGKFVPAQKHIVIIGLLLIAQKISFESKEQLSSFIKRHLRASRLLTPYKVRRIMEVMQYLHNTADYKWGLETVGKFIDYDLSKLKKINEKGRAYEV